MAETSKGITYPSTPSAQADILEDLETMAESIDTVLDGYQTEIGSGNKISADNVDDTNTTNKFATSEQLTQISTNTSDISAIKDGTNIDSFSEVETALETKQDEITEANKLASDLVDDTEQTNKFVTAEEKAQISENETDIEELQEENTYLKSLVDQIIPTETLNGTDLTFDNTIVGKLKLNSIEGNCEQDTIAYIDVGTWEQGIINSSGDNAPDDLWVRTADYISVKPNILYNISRTISTSYMAFRFYDSNKTYLGNQSNINITTDQSDGRMLQNVSSMTLTINDTSVAYMRMADNSNDLSTEYTISTTAPNPDYPQDIRVVTGDNEVVVQNANIFDEEMELGAYTWTTGEKTPNNSVIRSVNKVQIPSNTECYVVTPSEIVIEFFDKDKVFLGSSYNINKLTSSSFTTPINAKYFVLYMTSSYGTTYNNDIAIFVGTSLTSYIAHAEQKVTLHLGSNYLAGIGEYADTIEGTKDNWKIVRKVGKVVLDGSEQSWNSYDTDTINRFYLYLQQTGIADLGLSNYFIRDDFNNRANANSNLKFFVGYSSTNFSIQFRKDGTTLADFKTWLSTHNVIVYYALATPTEETITDTTLIADLNALYEARSYADQTNITTIYASGNAQMSINITALKQLS